MAKNPVSHSRTKHIDIKYHYVREAIQEKETYCPTENMLADLFHFLEYVMKHFENKWEPFIKWEC